MKLTTEFCIYRSWTEEETAAKVAALLEELAAFASIKTNSALWDDQPGECIYVVGFRGIPHYGDKIPCSDISKVARKWADGVVSWCQDDPDEDTLPDDYDDDDDEDESEEGEEQDKGAKPERDYANRRLRVEAEDLDWCGGIRIRTFDVDDELCDEISFVGTEKPGE